MLKSRLLVLFALLGFVPALTSAAASGTGYCAAGGTISTYASWYCSQANQAISSQWATWEPIALIAVILSFSVATIIFIAAQLLNNQRIRSFAIGEYYEAAATAIIVAGFLFLTAVMIGLLPSLVIGTNPYVSSLNYINSTINNTQTMLTVLFNVAVTDKQLASTHLALCAGPAGATGASQILAPAQSASGIGGTATPVVYAGAGTGALNTVSSFLCNDIINDFISPAVTILFYIPATTFIDLQSDALALLYGEFYLIVIFMYAAIPVFLIPGIILRSILPLRGLGGMMIAVAIGTFIIMPTLFSVAYYFTNASMQSQLLSATSALSQYGNGPGAQLNAITPQAPLVQQLNLMESGLGAYWMSVLFYPALIFALTYALIVQIAQFLGNMTSMSNKLKIL